MNKNDYKFRERVIFGERYLHLILFAKNYSLPSPLDLGYQLL